MARVNIPRSEYRVLKQISELNESDYSAIVDALLGLDSNLGHIDLVAPVSKKVPHINAAELKSWLRTLFSLYRLSDARGRTPKEMASDVGETIEREKPSGFTPEVTATLRKRLERLLEIGGVVSLAAKAVDLMSEHDKLFCGSRVLSDIRPIFGQSPESVSAAIISHSLNISFHKDGEHQEFYVSLSTNDLRALKKVIERAEKKSDSLIDFVQKSGVKLLSEGE